MIFSARWKRFLDNRMNPVMVKELRQSVKGKIVPGLLMLFLLVLVCILGGVLLTYDIRTSRHYNAGSEVFLFFFGVLMFTCLGVIPASAGFRMNRERSDVEVDLLYVSTLKPGEIIRGKFWAAMAIILMIFATCMPFMALTYLLRGIDLPSIFVLLAGGLVVAGAFTLVVLLVSVLPMSKIFKTLLGLSMIGGFLLFFSGVISISYELLREGIGSQLGSWSRFWAPALTLTGGLGGLAGLCYVLAAACITPPSLNRAMPIRIYLTILWAIWGAVVLIWAISSGDDDILMAWLIPWIAAINVMFIAAVSERDELGIRVRREIPASFGKRTAAFSFFSGAANGLIWSILMCLITLMLGLLFVYLGNAIYRSTLHEVIETVYGMGGMSLYIFSYALTMSWLRRRFFQRRIAAHYTWLLILVLIGLGSILPPVILFLAKMDPDRYPSLWFGLNPFVFLYEMAKQHSSNKLEICWFIAVGWAFLSLILNWRWIDRQIRGFKPLKQASK